MKSD
jgi:hypothetical protein